MGITLGKDYNYFGRIAVSSASFNNDADAIFAFNGNSSFSLINEGTGTIEYSFNGSTVHGDLVPNTPSAGLGFNRRGQAKVWFRLKSGAISNVRIEAFDGEIGALSSGGGGTVSIAGSVSTSISSPIGPKTPANSVSIVFATSGIQAAGQTSITGGATAAPLTSSTTYPNGIQIRNLDASNTVYIGKDNTVTNTNGFPIKAGETWSATGQWDPSTIYLYASNTLTVAYLGLS